MSWYGVWSLFFRRYKSILPSSFTQVYSQPEFSQPVNQCWFWVRFKKGVLPAKKPRWCLVKANHNKFFRHNPLRVFLLVGWSFRIYLRDRLTLRCFPVRRNPVTFGFFDSNEDTRYSYQHSHLCIFQKISQFFFAKKQSGLLLFLSYKKELLLQRKETGTSVQIISSYTFVAQISSISELLRFLERMAASKPTCWLSSENHFLEKHFDLSLEPLFPVGAVSLVTLDLCAQSPFLCVSNTGIQSFPTRSKALGHLLLTSALPPVSCAAKTLLKELSQTTS